MKCFYHLADLDGHCSGFLVSNFFRNCKVVPIDYGQDFPWNSISDNEVVTMVDFSLQPFFKMLKLNAIAQLTWIDHHKSAIEEAEKYEARIAGLQKIGSGACELVWEYLYHTPVNQTCPTFVELLGQYDVWDFSDPRTLPFQYGLKQYDTNPENKELWTSLFDVEQVNRIVDEGRLLLKYQNRNNESYVKGHSFETELDGLKCIAINKGYTNSRLFDSVWDKSKYDAMLTFVWKNGKWTVSLYSDRDDVDVSAICKARGGGGHKGAAGFQCSELPFKLA